MGQLDAVKAFLTLQPKLIDAKGPHGFSLHFPRTACRKGFRKDVGLPALDQENRSQTKSLLEERPTRKERVITFFE